MLRLRILLLLLWYYSITKANNIDTNKINKPSVHKCATNEWSYVGGIKNSEFSKNHDNANKTSTKTKREISESDENEDSMTVDKRPSEKNRRKVSPDYLDVVDTENTKYLQHLASLISKYRGKYVQYGFVVGRAEDIINLDMIRRCMTPIEIPKHFSPWLGKRSPGIQDAMQKRCLETLVQPVDYSPAAFEGDGKKSLQPFRPWGGKRDSGETKKTNFNAWGGKRHINIEPTPKKSQFTAWGGKRIPEYPQNPIYPKDKYPDMSYYLENYERPARNSKFNAWGGKRLTEYPLDSLMDMNDMSRETRDSRFNAWGGKRTIQDPVETERQIRNVKFNSWGGKKRAVADPIDMERPIREAKFTSWGGKRSYDNPTLDDSIFPENIQRQGRAKFNAWGGKRGNHNINLSEEPSNTNKIEEILFPSGDGQYEINSQLPDAIVLTRNRINVQSMGNIASLEGMLLPSDFDLPELQNNINQIDSKDKRDFSAWGGKRSINDVNPTKKGKFVAWGGKRSADYSSSENIAHEQDSHKSET